MGQKNTDKETGQINKRLALNGVRCELCKLKSNLASERNEEWRSGKAGGRRGERMPSFSFSEVSVDVHDRASVI